MNRAAEKDGREYKYHVVLGWGERRVGGCGFVSGIRWVHEEREMEKVLRLRGRTGMQENGLCGENSSKGKMYE